jgi:hypothetical protein
MDQPEDLQQLVLGMTSPALFDEMLAEAPGQPQDRLSHRFDEKRSAALTLSKR